MPGRTLEMEREGMYLVNHTPAALMDQGLRAGTPLELRLTDK